MSDSALSLEAIRAKLRELQQRQMFESKSSVSQAPSLTVSTPLNTHQALGHTVTTGTASLNGIGQQTGEFTDTHHTATSTFEMEDHKARMKRIEAEGNSPEEWKAYIDFLKTVSSSSDIRRRPLSEAFNRAFYGILNSRENKDSEVFVRIIMDYVQFKSERLEWDSMNSILDMARSCVHSFAVIIVASAEMKILKGDPGKALTVLTKALAKGRAQPKDLLVRAIKAAEMGQSKLLSDSERKLEAPGIFGKQNKQDPDEFKVPSSSGLSQNYTHPLPDTGTEQDFGVVPSASSSCSNIEVWPPEHPCSGSKPAMRHYSSTPEVRSALQGSASQLQSSIVKRKLGLPMRVRNPLQQHAVHMLSAEKEEDTDFLHSIKPIQPLPGSTTGRPGFVSTASSGYQSDLTVPMEDSNLSQSRGLTYRDVFSPSISASQKDPTSTKSGLVQLQETSAPVDAPGHVHRQPEPAPADTGGGTGDPSALPVSSVSSASQAIPAPVVVSAPAASSWQGAVPVMSTPSCKDQQMPPVVAPTPNGEFIETVAVNGEHYHVLKKVGRGGSAQVYMVFDSKKNVRALKVVDLEGAGPEVIDGFRNEISLLQRLQYCDSVIKMYNFEYNEKLNRLHVILEFGETDLSGFFTARAKQKRGLDPTMIKFYWGEMLRAVNALHREGIIHSDLKPANFMLVAGNLKLIDFGIANALQQDKTSVLKDARVGTPSYMSPEAIMAACDDGMDDSADEKENTDTQARPKYKVGTRSDVWSLGCILYNMVYGRTPFQHIKNNMCKLQAITNPACDIKFPAIPDALLTDVLKKCLTRDVKSRPTTKELLDHPYLTTSDKDTSQSHTSATATTSASTSISRTAASTPGNKGEGGRRLKELLQSHMAQGSPGTQALITNLMQKLETEQKAGSRAVLPVANSLQ